MEILPPGSDVAPRAEAAGLEALKGFAPPKFGSVAGAVPKAGADAGAPNGDEGADAGAPNGDEGADAGAPNGDERAGEADAGAGEKAKGGVLPRLGWNGLAGVVAGAVCPKPVRLRGTLGARKLDRPTT